MVCSEHKEDKLCKSLALMGSFIITLYILSFYYEDLQQYVYYILYLAIGFLFALNIVKLVVFKCFKGPFIRMIYDTFKESLEESAIYSLILFVPTILVIFTPSIREK